MFNFLVGLAVGTAFAPFWMSIWNRFLAPKITELLNKSKK